MLDLKVNVWSEIPQKTTTTTKIKFNKRYLHDEKYFLLEVTEESNHTGFNYHKGSSLTKEISCKVLCHTGNFSQLQIIVYFLLTFE